MNDPYKTLGVSPQATDDEVKAAYRELAKKYHPDNYVDNPLSDLATEKMKEINEAYDEVVRQRRSGSGSSRSSGGSYQGNSSGYQSSGFRNIRDMISQGRTAEAQAALEAVAYKDRGAEWYFLKGSLMYNKGWVNEAYANYQKAVQMDPNNPEYRQAYETVNDQMNGGFYGRNRDFGGYNTGRQGGCSGCDLCTSLLCADMCCECGGGNLCC